ncbi:hypothetical protein TruAng_009063 [Truncatella angustata]|nr:hypothetical protein TruAng_009063 [Truncatella angustata]
MFQQITFWPDKRPYWKTALASSAPLDHLELDTRDVFAISERDVVATRVVAPRVVTTLTGNANFERFNVSGTTVSEVGYYGGLFYRGIAAVPNTTLSALQPRQIGSNFGAYGAVTASLNSKPFITSRFSGSKTQSFGLTSFFFGCTDADGTTAVSCRLAFAGYDAFNRLLAYQTFTFNPRSVNTRQTSSAQALAGAVLNGAFSSGLVTIRLATQYDGDVGLTALDNIRYSIVQNINSTSTTTFSSLA